MAPNSNFATKGQESEELNFYKIQKRPTDELNKIDDENRQLLLEQDARRHPYSLHNLIIQ